MKRSLDVLYAMIRRVPAYEGNRQKLSLSIYERRRPFNSCKPWRPDPERADKDCSYSFQT